MNPGKVLLCVATLGLASAAHADVVTPDLSIYKIFGIVSNAYPGIVLKKLTGISGTSYAVTESAALRSSCTTYAACAYLSPVWSIGGNLFNAGDYRDCYNQTQANGSSPMCAFGFEVMQGTFTNPTNFVEFQFTWTVDPPGIFGYDDAGNEIVACIPYGGSASLAGCTTSFMLTSSGDYIGTVRLTSPSATIKRVVAGSIAGSSRLIGLQFNKL